MQNDRIWRVCLRLPSFGAKKKPKKHIRFMYFFYCSCHAATFGESHLHLTQWKASLSARLPRLVLKKNNCATFPCRFASRHPVFILHIQPTAEKSNSQSVWMPLSKCQFALTGFSVVFFSVFLLPKYTHKVHVDTAQEDGWTTEERSVKRFNTSLLAFSINIYAFTLTWLAGTKPLCL